MGTAVYVVSRVFFVVGMVEVLPFDTGPNTIVDAGYRRWAFGSKLV